MSCGSRPSGRSSTRGSSTPRTCSAGPSGGSSGAGWRPGLSRPHHDEIYRRLAPFLLPAKGTSPAKKAGRPKPEPHELAEMWRCAASLERLTPEIKESLGDALLKESTHARLEAHVLWCLGRLGAGCRSTARPTRSSARRPPSAGPRRSSAARSRPAARPADAIFALAQLARVAGDRARDLDDALRQHVLARLTELGADEAVLRPVREYHELETAQQVQALGDSLPIGLRLLSDVNL